MVCCRVRAGVAPGTFVEVRLCQELLSEAGNASIRALAKEGVSIYVSNECTLQQPCCMVLRCALRHTMPAKYHRSVLNTKRSGNANSARRVPAELFGSGRGLQAAAALAAAPAAAGSVLALPSKACPADCARVRSRAILWSTQPEIL